MNRDRFSALPVHIRHHILTYFDSEIVERDHRGNVLYIGQAALGEGFKPARFKLELLKLWRRHGLAQVSRQCREDFQDLFFSLNKFEFVSGPLLIEFLDTMLDDRRLRQLTSLRFTLRSHARVPMSADGKTSMRHMRRIYKLFFLCVNLKELELRAQVYWKRTGGLTESFTFPVEDALSHFKGTSLNENPISFGDLIENAPGRHGYNEGPRRRVELDLPRDLRSKYERVQGILASAYDIVLKERQKPGRKKQQRQEQASRPIMVVQELSDREAQKHPLALHPWMLLYVQDDEEAMRAGPADMEVAVPLEPGPIGLTTEHPDGEVIMASAYPIRCPTHHGLFDPGCFICKLEWEQDIDPGLQRSVQSQPPPPQASPRTSLNVNPSEPGSFSPWCPNHQGILEPTCPRCTAEGTANMDLEIGRISQWHSPLPQAGLSEPLATALSTPAYSSPFHHMLAENVHYWLDLSSPLYLMPTHDPNIFAYYLAMMEWAWNNGLEQPRIDAMTRAILARVDRVAFQAWLETPSGIPDPKETWFGSWERRTYLDSLY